jgi:mono/diheme cytochrome c family protein
MRNNKIMLMIVCLATLLFFVSLTASQKALAGDDKGYIKNGQKLFTQYCISCHGVDGKGDGPVSASLKIPPTDLTTIQKKGEKFPFDHVMTAIDGERMERSINAHGTSKMPVWGTVFRRTSGLQKEGYVYSLAKYIESIQTIKN